MTASTNPDVGLTFEATGHLIPQFDIGLTAFSGIASSTIFVNLDASTDFTISTSTEDITQACANASTTLNVGVGAQASFFSLFDASVGKTLFNRNFPLLQVGMTTSVPLFALNDDNDDYNRINASAVRQTRTQTGTLPLLAARPLALASERCPPT